MTALITILQIYLSIAPMAFIALLFTEKYVFADCFILGLCWPFTLSIKCYKVLTGYYHKGAS